MEKNQHLAIASVPIQEWNEVYDEEQALRMGTIFPELCLPFCGKSVNFTPVRVGKSVKFSDANTGKSVKFFNIFLEKVSFCC